MALVHFISIGLAFLLLFLSIHHAYPKIKEHVINKYIKLKLEHGRTIIYVNNRPFRQCMYLLMNIPVNRIEEYDEIRSIDEAAEKLDRSLERRRVTIPAETEFWGHCSNIQAWYENDYDTRILHRNLAFPLLKSLTDVGDPLAKKRFKEEIAMRYASGHPTVMRYLAHSGYLNYLSDEDFESILDELDAPIIDEIAQQLQPLISNLNNPDFKKQANNLINRFLRVFRIKHKYLILPKIFSKISEDSRQHLAEFIYNKYRSNRSFPMDKFLNYIINNFKGINFEYVQYDKGAIAIIIGRVLNLSRKNVHKISNIKNLEKYNSQIEELNLNFNHISEIEGLEKFTSLKILKLDNNRITQISNLKNLSNIRFLSIRNNSIIEIKGLSHLNTLEYLDLSGNIGISEIPISINQLPSLKTLILKGCKIQNFSEEVSHFFWMGENYRSYSNYTLDDIRYYESTHRSRAIFNNKLYKHFVKWLFKMRSLMNKFNFNYDHIESFERKTSKNAINSGRLTNSFKKWLDDRYQTRITSFF